MTLITTGHFAYLWTNEAHFNLNGNVNTRNCVHWADTNPHVLAPRHLLDAKVTVWCRISGTILLGPFFFEEATPTDFLTYSVNNFFYSAAKLCHTRIASAKCTKWYRLDARWCTSTHSEVCSQGPRTPFWWPHNLTPFFFSVASAIPWSHSYVFLILGIYQIHSLHMQSLKFARVKRFYKALDCKHPSYQVALGFIVHHLPHAMSNCLWCHPCGKCLI